MALTSYALQGVALYVLTLLIQNVVKRVGLKKYYEDIRGPDGGSFLFGHLSRLFATDGLIWHKKITTEYGGVLKIGTLLGGNTLVVSDPRALYHIFVKDHETIWDESPIFVKVNLRIFGPGLVSTLGPQHRKQRKLVNPVFSAKHLRDTTPALDEVTTKLADVMSKLAGNGKEIEVYDWLSRAALEGIGQSGFGYSFNALDVQGKLHPYAASVKLLHNRLLSSTIMEQFIIFPFIEKWNPGGRGFQRWVMSNLTWGTYREISDVVDTMERTAIEIYEHRKQELEKGSAVSGAGKDILSALMQVNSSSSAAEKMTDEEILAQITTMVFAGMDTTSSAMSRLLWVLSTHQEAQDRLREEIRQAKENYGPTLTYDEIMGLPYLDAVVRETLRMYPPVPVTNRGAAKDAVLPLHTPVQGANGKVLTEVIVPGNTDVLISLVGCNTSTQLWGPDAGEWKPERWLDEAPQTLTDAKIAGVYSNLMTFIAGSRSCVGFKFAQLEIKLTAFHLLDRLKFSPAVKEVLWRPAAVIAPAVDFKETEPRMPMFVENV